MNYFEHNDQRGQDTRLRAQAWNADRMHRLRSFWDGTLTMTAREVWRARFAGALMACKPARMLAPREPRNERDAHRAMMVRP